MREKRWVWGAIVVVVLVFLSLFVAPNQANLRQGSTYSRAPSGYGAWYAYMQEQGANIQRWQRPLYDLMQPVPPEETPIEQEAVPIEYRKAEGRADEGMGGWGEVDLSSFIPQPTAAKKPATILSPHSSNPLNAPITLLQVDNGRGQLGSLSQLWIKQGNVVIQLGNTSAVEDLSIEFPVTRSPFTSVLSSAVGGVKVETSRRFTELQNVPKRSGESIASRLADTYGTVVLERKVGKGKIITAIAPYLAANAYQDEPGNFKFLEQLVTEAGNPIWVDEYLHGYKDREGSAGGGSGNSEGSSGGAEETPRNLLSYLARTPLSLVAVQAIVLLLVLIWGLNRRLGPVVALANPKVDNSVAYIQALASVLHKANCSEFVMETIGKAEQLQVQRSLGLGNDLLDPVLVIEAWVQQTGRSAFELEEVLSYADRRRFSESELLDWLGKVRSVRQHLP